MPRLPLFVALTTPLALAAVACSSDNVGSTATGTGPTATAPSLVVTPADIGLAVAAPDQEAYLQTVAGLGAVQETCQYLPERSLADCTERGSFKLQPPPANTDSLCVIGLSGGGAKPEYVLCSNPSGGESTYFVIQP
jgi:hypothetical protein